MLIPNMEPLGLHLCHGSLMEEEERYMTSLTTFMLIPNINP